MESDKWVGTASAYFPSASVEEMWAVVGEFCAADRWMLLDACCKLGEGQEENKPGCVRFCIAGQRWSKERLVAFEPTGHSYRYDVADNNLGIGDYSAAVKVIPRDGEPGCRVEWSFESDPVQGLSRDGLITRLQSALGSLGKLFQ
ncbi:hypothetical protein KSP40_PGU021806 [Platanthera guangdongensis]|uniref:Lachrymatory factor synthase n=1 Tax=Platanthera guangdongensis TaxID=2320717 RepID=A0ABR2M4B2_9ASPA